MRSELREPLRLTALYALFSVLWILLSDSLLNALSEDRAVTAGLQLSKGLLFVVLSSALIFMLAYRSQRALHQQHQRSQQHIEQLTRAQRNAGVGSWHYRHDFHWSPEAMGLLGREHEPRQSSLEQFLSWLHPADRASTQRALMALLESQTALCCIARLLPSAAMPDTWLMLRGEADPRGTIFGTLQNISAQKRDEHALRESEKRFRQLFEQTPRIAVQGYDRERRVIYWNQASTQLYGYEMHEALGRRLEELIVPPAARNKVISAINQWQLGGPPIPAAEVQLQCKDERLIWVYSSHLMLRNSLDQLELYCVDIDLTQQKQIDLDLQLSENRYRTLVEHLGDGIFVTQADDSLCFLNPAWEQISGYTVQESLGSPLQRFMPELGQIPLSLQLEELRSSKLENVRLECQLLTRTGEVRQVELQISRCSLQAGLHGSLRDVHERHQAHLLQRARNAVLDELLGLHPLPDILGGITRRLESLQPQMRVSIMLIDEQKRLHVGAAPSLPDTYNQAIEGIQADLQVGSCGHAASTGELVIAENISQHPYWKDFKALAMGAGLQACWSLPFKDDSGKVLGTFGIYYPQPTRPSSADIALVTEFTRLAGLAVQFRSPADAHRIEGTSVVQ